MSQGRPRTRTDILDPSIALAIKTLFTPKKAMELLRLPNEGISYKALRRAISGETLVPVDVTTIEIAWRQWATRYLSNPTETEFMR